MVVISRSNNGTVYHSERNCESKVNCESELTNCYLSEGTT